LQLKPIEKKILSRKSYKKPEITRIFVDNSITLVMMTIIPPDPPPRGKINKYQGVDNPFKSPFGDKPFA
jgi:hypothetical protein